jgi:uncharacterized protein (TIGR00297 family)
MYALQARLDGNTVRIQALRLVLTGVPSIHSAMLLTKVSVPVATFTGIATLWQNPGEMLIRRVLAASLITLIFALIAYRMRSVTLGGAVAGSLVSVVIFSFAGPAAFAGLAAVFFLTAAATRIGYTRKQKLGMAEYLGGRRASQVLANLTVPAVLSIFSLQYPWVLVLVVAALAEAAADTVSSECGQAWSDSVYLITNFERVPVGTDGGISLPGTLAGVFAATMVAFVCGVGHLVPAHGAVIGAAAGVLGTFVDSLLGASLERRHWLTNNLVNLLSTAAAAAFAGLLLL